MASLAQNAGSFGQVDPNAILNECRSIDQGIDEIEKNLKQIQMLHNRSINDVDTSSRSATSIQLDALSSQTMDMYRGLTTRVRKIKSNPDSRLPKNAGQVNRIDQRLKQAIQRYQEVDSAFRKQTRERMAHQYRIAFPDASDAEVRAAVEDNPEGQQVFQQALMQSNRTGQARAVLSAVQDRQRAIQKIEQQMVELAQLFQDMDTLIMQQDAQIVNIEQKGEEVVENLHKGNEEIAVAVTTARKTRRKKWWCLGICVALIVVIAVIVVVYIMVTKPPNAGKRSIEARGVAFVGEKPVSRIYAQSKIVIPGLDHGTDTLAAPVARFAGNNRARDVPAQARDGAAEARKIIKIGKGWNPAASSEVKARRDRRGNEATAKAQRRYAVD